MANKERVELGAVQRTLFFPLVARARETRSRRPLLCDEKAVELVRAIDFDPGSYSSGPISFLVMIRTMILDWWVEQFLAEHPAGTVVELGTGLNTRFDRLDNGTVHWIDLDLPDTIEVRRRFFDDTSRRRMIAASLLDEDWLAAVEELPGPYFFVSDAVLVYLREEEVARALGRIAGRFGGAMLAFDTYPGHNFAAQHRMAAKGDFAPFVWACDDPRSLERLGLRLVEAATVTSPPAGLRERLPAMYRHVVLPLAGPIVGRDLALNLFRVSQPGAPLTGS
jgi:O-methyltransferase involved in polyketide biosynthesis